MGFKGTFQSNKKSTSLPFPKLMINRDSNAVAYFKDQMNFMVVASDLYTASLGSFVTIKQYTDCYHAGWTDFEGEVILKNG
jgi:hypothetical protein